MKIVSNIMIFVVFMAVSFIVQANFDEQFSQARSEFLAINQENSGSFEVAWEKFTQLDKQYPNHPAIQAYYGSLETIKARDSWMPWTKLKWAEQGLERIDHALSLMDESHEKEMLGGSTIALNCRLVAANTYLNVPSFLNRLQEAKDVFFDLIETPNLESLPAEARREIYSIGLKIAEKEEQLDEKAKWQQKLNQLIQ